MVSGDCSSLVSKSWELFREFELDRKYQRVT